MQRPNNKKGILGLVFNIIMIILICIPSFYSIEVEYWVLNYRNSLVELYNVDEISFSQEFMLIILDHLFGLGISALLMIISTIMLLLINAPKILKAGAALAVGMKIDDE